MGLLCSLTLSAFCFLFLLLIQLHFGHHINFWTLSLPSPLPPFSTCHHFALMQRYEFLTGFIWYTSRSKPYTHRTHSHVSFEQWNEQRNEFLSEKLLISFYILSIFDLILLGWFSAFAFRYVFMELKLIYSDGRTDGDVCREQETEFKMWNEYLYIDIGECWCSKISVMIASINQTPTFHCLFL